MISKRASLLSMAMLAACQSGATEAEKSHSPSCLENAHTDYRVQLEAEGLGDFEGATAFAVTEMQLAFADATCRADGAAPIAGGAFSVDLANLTDEAVYPLVAAFLDLDGDGACTESSDLGWQIWASTAPDVVLTLSAADFEPASPELCARFGP